MDPDEYRPMRAASQPLGGVSDSLLRMAGCSRGRGTQTRIVSVKPARESLGIATAGIEPLRTDEGGSAITLRFQNGRQVRHRVGESIAEFGRAMGLRISARQQSRVRDNGERGLGVGAFENDALLCEGFEVGSGGLPTQKSDAVGPNAFKGDEDDARLVGAEARYRQNGSDKRHENEEALKHES